jgi:predicted transcriptional regulator of viral defense system
MKLADLLDRLGELPFFDLPTATQIFREDRHLVRVQIHRWVKAGRLVPLRRGMYAFAEPYRKAPISPAHMANEIYKPSCLSCRWALSFYGLIPEKTVVYTSVTPKAPRRFTNAFGEFRYFHIKPALFFGFSLREIGGAAVRLADPEKALFDTWHLGRGEWTLARMEEMRFQEFALVDDLKLGDGAKRFRFPRIMRALENWRQLAARSES